MKVFLMTKNAVDSTCLPLGLYSLVTYFQKKHPEQDVQFTVQYFQNVNSLKVLKQIAKEKPEIVGLGCYIWNMPEMLSLSKTIKGLYPEIRLVLGGPQISFTSEELRSLVAAGTVDYLILGEGEITFSELVIHLKNQAWAEIAKIPGLLGKDQQGEIFTNPRSKEYQVDLDEMPNLYLTIPELKQAISEKPEAIYLETSRGCPYQCAYCGASANYFAYKSVENIMRELQELAQLGIKEFRILDGTLNFNLERTKTLLRQISALNLDLKFEVEVKIELLDDELIQLLKKAGVEMMEIGLQSSNEETLKIINRYHDRQKFITNVHKLVQNDFKMVIDIIIGLPGEEIEDWYNSLDFCYHCGDIEITGIVLKLLPNTPLYRDKEKYGYIYNQAAMNRVTASRTMTTGMFDFAGRMVRVLYAIWSKPAHQELRPYIRNLCARHYDNKFSQLLKDLTIYADENELTAQVPNFSLENAKKLVDYFIEERFGEGSKCNAGNQ